MEDNRPSEERFRTTFKRVHAEYTRALHRDEVFISLESRLVEALKDAGMLDPSDGK